MSIIAVANVASTSSDESHSPRDIELYESIASLTESTNERWESGEIARAAATIGGPASLFRPNLLDRLRRSNLAATEQKIARLAAVIDAVLDISAWWPAERSRVQSPGDLAAIALPVFGRATQEELHVAIVDGRNGLLALHRVYVGTATGTSVRIGELLRPVLDLGGVGFALVHNHPSGDPEPSDEDLRLTVEVLAAARLLDVEFLDHVVLGHGRWASIRTIRGTIWGAEGERA